MEKTILETGSSVKTTLKLPGKKDFFTQEAFKTLRTNLQFCGQDICTVVITSCNENEGKTTITLQLAKSLAELDKRVLVIDADMRKSVMAGRNTTAENPAGLSEVLTGLTAAAEFLKEQYPDMTGFSPRNVRRMRDFWQLYGGMPELLGEALCLNWTQNVVIMEAELTAEERRWYIQQAAAQNLSKSELLRMITDSAHLESVLDEKVDVWYNESNDEIPERTQYEEDPVYLSRQYLPQPHGRVRDEGLGKKGGTGIAISY